MFRTVVGVIGCATAVGAWSVVHAILGVGNQDGSGWAREGDGFEGTTPGVVLICKEKCFGRILFKKTMPHVAQLYVFYKLELRELEYSTLS